MPLQRSNIEDNRSGMNVFEREFWIEPEYLENDEIRHELRARGVTPGGDRRTIAARLRACVSEEKRNPGAYAMFSVGMPSEEVEYCARNADRLRNLLQQVSLDPVTHDRFMSVFLHLEGRINRIPKKDRALDLSAVIFHRNEEYSEIYNEFVQKVKALMLPRRIANDDPRVSNMTDNRSQTPPAHINGISNGVVHSNLPGVVFSNLGASSPRGGNHNDMSGADSLTLDRSNTNVSGTDAGSQLMRQLIENVDRMPNTSNATMNMGDNARLSQQFQPIGRQLLTPINSSGFQPAMLYTVANNQSMPATASHGSILLPPSNYGDGRTNSLPNSFGFNPSQSSLSGQISSIPPQNTDNIPSNFGGMPPQANVNTPWAAVSAVNGNRNHASRVVDNLIQTNLSEPSPNGNTYIVPRTGQLPSVSLPRDIANHNANGANTVPPASALEEKLDFLMATLASLTDEVSTIKRLGNPTLSDPNTSSSQVNRVTNPSATYTVDQNHYPNATAGTQISFNRPSHHNVPIHKWNWKFSADKTSTIPERRDLAAFLKKLELYRVAEDLSHEQIHKKFHFLIDGCVYEWYMQYRHNFTNWEQLLGGLKKQFTTPLTHFMKVAKLAARRQGKTETAMTYIASIQREFDELGMYSEKEKISIIQNGLTERLRNVALSHDWDTVQAMDLHLRTIEVADELRKETESQIQRRMFFPRRSINAIETEERNVSGGLNEFVENDTECDEYISGDAECQAVRAKGSMGKNVPLTGNVIGKHAMMGTQTRNITTCYNCKSESHRLIDCSEPITRIFCFRCGKEGVRAPNCTCGSKNSRSVACSTTESCDQQPLIQWD